MNPPRNKMTSRDEMRRFGGFALTGGLAALVNLLSRFLISIIAPYEAAVAIAYVVGMTTAFVLARRFVFEASGRHWTTEYWRFAMVNVFAFIQVWVVSVGLVRFAFPALGFDWHPEELGHLIGVASPIVTSYYAHKHFSFKSRSRDRVRRATMSEDVDAMVPNAPGNTRDRGS